MSTQPQPPQVSPKTAAKRRAAVRRRNREWRQRVFAITFVIIVVLGTAVGAFTNLYLTQTPIDVNATATAVAQASPTGSGQVVGELEKKGDEYAAQNDMPGAISSYKAAASLDQQNASLQYKIGNLLIQQANYSEAALYLQRAVQLDPSGTNGTQAKALMDQYASQLATAAVSTPATTVTAATGTGGITNTTSLTTTAPITGTEPVTNTEPITSTGSVSPTLPLASPTK